MAKEPPFDPLFAFITLVFASIGAFVFVQLVGLETSPVALAVTLGVAFLVGGFWKRITD